MPLKDKQLEPIRTDRHLLDAGVFPTRYHDYHELIFIRSGDGRHINQQVSSDFTGGELFLVKRLEEHSFELNSPAEIYIARFTEQARLTLKDLVDHSHGKAVALAKAKSPLTLKVNFNPSDRRLVDSLFQSLLLLNEDPMRNENLSYYQFLCLVMIIERNLSYQLKGQSHLPEKENISLILKHIHKNLLDPEMLSLSYIADKYHLTPNRLAQYFRKEMDQSVKQYINECRLKSIGEKVIKSDLSFSEITYQYGYADESHFYKSFKKYYGVSPTDYRKSKGHIRD